MTTGGFREVDQDLLADYLGGALDGTPDEATVARLVEEDAAWAEAYARLAPAVADVRADLRAWGGTVDEMPPDVADRLTAALTTATEARAHTGPIVPPQPHGPRRPGGVRGSGVPATTGPGRRRRRWTRIAAPVALAAVAVTAVGLLGVDQLVGQRDGADSAVTGAGSEEAAALAAQSVRTTGPPLHTGVDYTPAALGALSASVQAQPFASRAPSSQSGVETQGGRVAGPIGLDRLEDPAALTACLTEIGAEHGGGPLVVDLVDYARFQGRPALVVRFTDASGARWAWVSGPECGVPGSGSDARYQSRVG